ncbi:MAG: hypothetical protein WC858_02675 [Parcubacteria group bacterium]|jgi:uncharacterized repeat protein (TIGR01451 family)
MSLKNIEESLYRREENPEEKKSFTLESLNPAQTDESPFAPASFSAPKNESKDVWIKEGGEEKKAKRKRITKIVLITAGVIALIVGIIYAAVVYRSTAFSEDKVAVTVSGPDKVKSGELATYEITYNNDNRAALKDAVVRIGYSDNFKPIGNLDLVADGPNASKYNIGAIDKKASGKLILKGKFFGPKDLMVYLNVKLDYSSSNFNSTFSTESKQSVFISSSPLTLELSGPQNASAGNSVTYTVKYENTGQDAFKDLKIKAEYPKDFTYISAEPLATRDNSLWYVGDLEAGQKGEIKFTGSISGGADEVKRFSASIGEFGDNEEFVAYQKSDASVRIVGSALLVAQTINKEKDNISVNAGETLNFNIKYKNTGRIGLKDIILTEEMVSPIIDYSTLRFNSSNGSLDSGSSVITWKGSDTDKLKLLEPGEAGEISFSVKIKDQIPIASTKDKNFSFAANAKMDSPDIPTPEGVNKIIASNTVGVKLKSKLLIEETGWYNDDTGLENSGSLPLKVGEETTFSIHLKLTNVSNDITNVKVAVTLAPGIKWKNNFLPKDASVSFNDRTNELTWNIGTMPAGVGILTDPKQLAFQIGATPSENQKGQYIPLISKAVFSADDTFTKEKLETGLGEKNSNLQEDISVGDSGKVAL